MCLDVRQHNAMVVYFKATPRNHYLLTEEEFRRSCAPVIARRFGDGAIYELPRELRTESASRPHESNAVDESGARRSAEH